MEKRLIPVAVFFVAIFLLFAFVGYDGGMTGFAVFNSGPGEGQTTITLQDADVDNLGDAYVSGALPNTNFGSDEELHVKWGSPKRNIYTLFNISAIPENQIIDNSTLCMYLFNDQASQTISVYNNYNTTWSEFDITWNNQPCGTNFDNDTNCDLIAASSVVTDSALDNSWLCWDVSDMMALEYSEGDLFSAVFHTSDTGNSDIFYSKEYVDDVSLRPYLNVTYHAANTAPIIALIYPEDGGVYLNNESLSLNFSVSDEDSNLDSCWYNLDDGVNVSISGCNNITFDVSGEGVYVLNIYANDSFGLADSDSIDFSVDLTGVSVVLTSPAGVIDVRESISLTYIVTGNSLECWYNIKTSIGGIVIDNTTLVDCNNSVFNVSSDGDYVANVFVNNSFGTVSFNSSSFSVDSSEDIVVVVNPPSGGGGGGGGGGSFSTLSAGGIVLSDLGDIVLDSGETRGLILNVKNSKLTFLDGCRLFSYGEYSDWFSSNEVMGLAGGQSNDFDFELSVPSSVGAGTYKINIGASCEDVNDSISFNVDILPKEIGFELISVDRISDGEVKIVYLLEEFSGIIQDVELQFLLLDSTGERVSEKKKIHVINPNSAEEFEVIIEIDESLGGDMSLLANLNSETYSTFVQENIMIGAPISGFSIVGGDGSIDKISSIVLAIVFLAFGGFIVGKIIRNRKGKGKKSVVKSKKNKNL